MTQLTIPTKSWWETDEYLIDDPLPQDMADLAGPNEIALARVYVKPDSVITQPGWGMTEPLNGGGIFPERYRAGEFLPHAAMYHYNKKGDPFAYVMRSMRGLVVDIDGKNGGLAGARKMGALPFTKAETSKSGNGYHLLYSTPDEWVDDVGFALVGDFNKIEQGVDLRGTGCVYHYPQQRWNDREIAPAPEWLLDRLAERVAKRNASNSYIQSISSLDINDQLMAHAELLTALEKPLKRGARNSTLFAIGTKLLVSGYPLWQQVITDKADAEGLSHDEAQQIVANITRYGRTAA